MKFESKSMQTVTQVTFRKLKKYVLTAVLGIFVLAACVNSDSGKKEEEKQPKKIKAI